MGHSLPFISSLLWDPQLLSAPLFIYPDFPTKIHSYSLTSTGFSKYAPLCQQNSLTQAKLHLCNQILGTLEHTGYGYNFFKTLQQTSFLLRIKSQNLHNDPPCPILPDLTYLLPLNESSLATSSPLLLLLLVHSRYSLVLGPLSVLFPLPRNAFPRYLLG